MTANATTIALFQHAPVAPTGLPQDFIAVEEQKAYSTTKEINAAAVTTTSSRNDVDVATIFFQSAAVLEQQVHSSTSEFTPSVTTPPTRPDAFNDVPVAARVFDGSPSINESGLVDESLCVENQYGSLTDPPLNDNAQEVDKSSTDSTVDDQLNTYNNMG